MGTTFPYWKWDFNIRQTIAAVSSTVDQMPNRMQRVIRPYREWRRKGKRRFEKQGRSARKLSANKNAISMNISEYIESSRVGWKMRNHLWKEAYV